MNEYRVAGRTAASDATADHGVAVLWNASSARQIWIVEFAVFNTTAATAQLELVRISVRGTPGSTVTPDIDNDVEHSIAPVSGSVLDLSNYSVEPTVASPPLGRYFSAATIGAGKIWNFRAKPIAVRGGAGFGLVNADAVAVPAVDVEVVFAE